MPRLLLLFADDDDLAASPPSVSGFFLEMRPPFIPEGRRELRRLISFLLSDIILQLKCCAHVCDGGCGRQKTALCVGRSELQNYTNETRPTIPKLVAYGIEALRRYARGDGGNVATQSKKGRGMARSNDRRTVQLSLFCTLDS